MPVPAFEAIVVRYLSMPGSSFTATFSSRRNIINQAKDSVSCSIFCRSCHILRFNVFSSSSVNFNAKMALSHLITCH